MNIIVVKDQEQAAKEAVKLFEETLKNGNEVFGLATGSTPESTYALLRETDLDFSNATALNLDEYYGLAADHPQSYAYFMQEQLFNAKPFKATYIPNGLNTNSQAEIESYNQVIADHPIDLQLLGIGTNAHIGFNEPGASFEQETALVDLADATIEANSRNFDTIDEVPRQAYSMGIKSIMSAKRILLMAFGPEKAQAIKDTVEGPVTEEVPASVLQNHSDVTLIIDEAAASLLSRA